MPLEKYNQKRNFDESPEPESSESEKEGALVFVIQRHMASRLHYDLRLEMEGVLKSWAVPKGPSLNVKDKRLAMMTEDHPFSYKDFEGEIPEGNYGAGIMEIWDSGYYHALDAEDREEAEKSLLKGLEKGDLKFVLDGKKLKGAFALVRIKNEETGPDNSWLLIKKKDDYAVNEPYNSEDHIAKNSKIKKGGNPKSKRKSSVKTTSEPNNQKSKKVIPEKAPKAALLQKVKPMLAKLIDEPFDDPDYIYEIKWDGYRAIAEIQNNKVKLYSRNGLSFNEKYPSLVVILSKINPDVVLDGEVVVLDVDGNANFQKLQNYKEEYAPDLCYYVFDILFLNGFELVDLPLLERKKYINEVIGSLPNIRYSDHIVENGQLFFKEAENNKLEGIIAKKSKSPYRMGKRSNDWLKIKTSLRQEFIICGFTEPKGGRKHMGSLVLGAYDKGNLVFVGHSGGGFTDKGLKETRGKLESYIQKTNPFKEKIKTNTPVTWLKPELVCEVSFAEWTEEKNLRHPVFQGFREDKDPKEVVLEEPAEIIKDHKGLKKVKENEKKKPLKTKKEEIKDQEDMKDKEEKKDIENSSKLGKNREKVKVGKHSLILSNLKKIYFPESGITKGDIINYYSEVGKFILPYLKDRPQSLHRHPNGTDRQSFFHKDMKDTLPDWMESKPIQSGSDKEINYLLCQNQATLTYMNNLGCIEINPWSSRIQSLENPDYTVIDLDPADNTFEEVIETALVVKDLLDKAGATSFCKTSGSSGMHIYVPLGAKYDYEQGKNFAHIIAQLAHAELPDITSIERSTKTRPKSIYIDYLQNRMGQTLASVYSVRPKPGATVSTPLEWKEVKKGLHPSQFTIKNMPDRLKNKGDLFKGVLGKGIDILKCLERLGG